MQITAEQFADYLVSKYPSIWSLKYKTIKGKPTTYVSKNPFKHRPWQRAILDDSHKNKVVEKSRQLGLSECGLTEVLHFLLFHDQVKVIYLFPRGGQVGDFSKTRVSPVLDDPYFEPFLDRNNNSVGSKKIGSSFLLFRSGWSGALGEGVDTDMVAFDEYDRMHASAELAFAEGLKSSQYGLKRRWSTPTIPGRGVNLLYSQSDQMRWIHTCPHCGHKQFLTFEDNIIQVGNGIHSATQEIDDGTFIIGCAHCKKELDRMQNGEWVAMQPSVKETRGYHISQMDAAWISADDIMRRQMAYSSKQLFFNYVIGQPYASEGMMITDEDIRAAVRLPAEVMSRTSAYSGIVAGIDWGDISYMTVLGIKPNGALDLLNLYSVKDNMQRPLRSVEYFCAVLRAYQPNIVVADTGFGADRNAYGFTQYPAAWYGCYWTTNKDGSKNANFVGTMSDTVRRIVVDKTVSIQRALHTLKGKLLGLFPWNEKLHELCVHAQNTRIMDEEDDGVVYQRATRIGPDHYMCALAYALVGVDQITRYHTRFNNAGTYDFV